MSEPIRLQKILAEAGFGSRRACEEFILEGRVMVDGQVVMELGTKANIEAQTITLDGQNVAGPGRVSKSVKEQTQKVYYMLNKPRGVLCTNDDPDGRPLAIQLVPDRRRVFCVGRLDIDTEGLVLLTNDGELTNLLTHPKFGVHKSYIAKVDGKIDGGQIMKLQNGVHLAEGKTQGALVRVRKRNLSGSVIEMEISEGMNRQIRRMLAAVNLNCRRLKRVRVGPVKLGTLPEGASRSLTRTEIDALYFAAETAKQQAASGLNTKPIPQRQSRDDVKAWREGHFEEVDDRFDDDSGEKRERNHKFDKPREQAASGGKPEWKDKKPYPKKEYRPRSQFERAPGGGTPDWKAKKEYKPRREFEGGGDGSGSGGGKPEWKDKKPWAKKEFKPRSEYENRGGDRGGFGGGKPEWKDKKPWAKKEFKPRSEYENRGGDRGGFGGGKPEWKDKKPWAKKEFKPRSEYENRGGDRGGSGGGKPEWKDKKPWAKKEFKPRGEYENRGGDRDQRQFKPRPNQDGIVRPAFQEKPEWMLKKERTAKQDWRASNKGTDRPVRSEGGGGGAWKDKRPEKRDFRPRSGGSSGFGGGGASRGGSSGGSRGGEFRKPFGNKAGGARPWQGKRDGDRNNRSSGGDRSETAGFKKFKPFKSKPPGR